MVVIKAPTSKKITMRFYLLLISSACLLCGTALFVTMKNPKSRGIRGIILGVKAHSARKMLRKPHLVYGTAWKKEETARLVSEAVKTGFRFIDTACQPKHYNEPGVGDGWMAAAQELGLSREDVWLQTKYTSYAGQDPNNVPYHPDLPVVDQARASLKVSLKNLHTDYLDSWILHSPLPAFEDTMAVWRVMEEAVDAGKVRQIGISNCYSMDVFRLLFQQARHKPAVSKETWFVCQLVS